MVTCSLAPESGRSSCLRTENMYIEIKPIYVPPFLSPLHIYKFSAFRPLNRRIMLFYDARHCEYQSLEYLQVEPQMHVVEPVYPIPPHCPHIATPPVHDDAVEVAALELLVVDVLEDVVVDAFEVLVEPLDVLVEVLLLLLLEPPLTPPGPFRFEIPVVCNVVGNNGSISFNQTVVYSPGLPSAARLPGSRLPHCPESAQQGL